MFGGRGYHEVFYFQGKAAAVQMGRFYIGWSMRLWIKHSRYYTMISRFCDEVTLNVSL